MASKTPSLLLCKRGEYNHRSKTTSSNLQRRCSSTITDTTMNSTKNTQIQSQDNIHIWNRFMHSGLAVQTKSQGKQ